MPTYEYRCESCESDFARTLRMSQRTEPQECPECGEGPAKKLVTGCGFILKGDGWAGKNMRVNRQMREKNRKLDRKQRDLTNDMNVRLSPNVGGERVDSWSEASKLAASQGKDTSGYDQKAANEK